MQRLVDVEIVPILALAEIDHEMNDEFGNAEDGDDVPGQTAQQVQDNGHGAAMGRGMSGKDSLPELLAEIRMTALGDRHEIRLQPVVSDAMREAEPKKSDQRRHHREYPSVSETAPDAPEKSTGLPDGGSGVDKAPGRQENPLISLKIK
ncbi:MAG TPA: hypothetical protein VL574_15300 [Stellaceae bacterium]|nr:hypothetical protein [Stellaceae bacterium]